MRGDETHKNKGGIQVFVLFLLEVIIVFGNFLLEFVEETGPGIGATVLLQHRF